MTTDVKVSVAMITYNHEAFITQAIESVLMQQTDFEVELVIGEDCSIDGTCAIVCEYADRYPGRIRLLLPERNQGAQANGLATLNACRGQYIALLEGDDYWTDATKLQKQVDYLENHPDYSACFHPAVCLNQINGANTGHIFRPRIIQPSYSTDDLLRGGNLGPTASLVFRKNFLPQLPEWFQQCPTGHFPLYVLLSLKGPIGFIDETMSLHRLHRGGMWSGADSTFWIESSLTNLLLMGKNLGLTKRESWKLCISGEYVQKYKVHLSRGQLASAFMSACRGLLFAPRGTILSILSQVMYIKDIALLVSRSARSIRYKGIRFFIQTALSRLKEKVSAK
jgi:glycosyltransferase involved in cell wall biosynthesis